MINEELKTEFPSVGFSDLESYHSHYRRRFYRQITFHERNPKAMLGHNGIKYLLWTLQRSKFLYLGFVDSLNLNNPTLAFLAARAHLETTSAIAYFFYKLKKYYDGKVTFEEVEDILFRLTLGYKSDRDRKKNREIPEAINVLTMIDIMDKLIIEFSEDSQKDYFASEKICRGFYEWLAENCHPNFEGMSVGSETKGPHVFFSADPELRESDLRLSLSAAEASCRAYFAFYDESFKLLEEREIMPILIK